MKQNAQLMPMISVDSVDRARAFYIEKLGFGPDVQRRGRLIQHQQAGSGGDAGERPGQRNSLPLTAGEVGAACIFRRQNGVLAVVEPRNYAIDARIGLDPVEQTGVERSPACPGLHVCPSRKAVPNELLKDHRYPIPGTLVGGWIAAVDPD